MKRFLHGSWIFWAAAALLLAACATRPADSGRPASAPAEGLELTILHINAHALEARTGRHGAQGGRQDRVCRARRLPAALVGARSAAASRPRGAVPARRRRLPGHPVLHAVPRQGRYGVPEHPGSPGAGPGQPRVRQGSRGAEERTAGSRRLPRARREHHLRSRSRAGGNDPAPYTIKDGPGRRRSASSARPWRETPYISSPGKNIVFSRSRGGCRPGGGRVGAPGRQQDHRR